jgi:hypothetical protein
MIAPRIVLLARRDPADRHQHRKAAEATAAALARLRRYSRYQAAMWRQRPRRNRLPCRPSPRSRKK